MNAGCSLMRLHEINKAVDDCLNDITPLEWLRKGYVRQTDLATTKKEEWNRLLEERVAAFVSEEWTAFDNPRAAELGLIELLRNWYCKRRRYRQNSPGWDAAHTSAVIGLAKCYEKGIANPIEISKFCWTVLWRGVRDWREKRDNEKTAIKAYLLDQRLRDRPPALEAWEREDLIAHGRTDDERTVIAQRSLGFKFWEIAGQLGVEETSARRILKGVGKRVQTKMKS